MKKILLSVIVLLSVFTTHAASDVYVIFPFGYSESADYNLFDKSGEKADISLFAGRECTLLDRNTIIFDDGDTLTKPDDMGFYNASFLIPRSLVVFAQEALEDDGSIYEGSELKIAGEEEAQVPFWMDDDIDLNDDLVFAIGKARSSSSRIALSRAEADARSAALHIAYEKGNPAVTVDGDSISCTMKGIFEDVYTASDGTVYVLMGVKIEE